MEGILRNNVIKEMKERNLAKESIEDIKTDLETIINDFKSNMIDPKILKKILQFLKEFKKKKNQQSINNLFSNDHFIIFRKVILEEKNIRIKALKILRVLIEISPKYFTNKYLNHMYPFIICKILEDFKHGIFEERYECLKLIHTWLTFSEKNFPLIFCQGIAAMAKGDEVFKKGSIEFLRNLAIKKPDLCSTVGGFRILINTLLDDSCIEMSDNIFYTLLYVINCPNKRKYFNDFEDFYEIFSIFTKRDFTLKDKDKNDFYTEEKNKTEVKLQISKSIIEKLLKTWPGYSLIMGDYMAMGSVIEALNTDTSMSIKSTILNMMKEILENEYIVIDNFTSLSSPSKDDFYINKVYLAYILQGLQSNKLYENLIKFIDSENNSLTEYAHKLTLKYTILYSKLSNTDLQLPFLNEKLEKQKMLEQVTNLNNSNDSSIISSTSSFKGIDDDVVNTKVKIMHLLDQTFYHFNCKDISNVDLENLSTEVIIASHSIVNMQNIKKYNNQYSIESSKKELYMITDDSFQQILKSSKLLDSKEFRLWDWKHIDDILDIVENRKDLIMDLYKQKFFKRLLFSFMPSKNQICSLKWDAENFNYVSIGSKFFKLLSNSSEGISILDTSPEDYIFQKTLTWYEDFQICLDNILNSNNINIIYDVEQPFSIIKIYKYMSRQIFTYIGIISQSIQGEEYLDKKGFFKLIAKFLNKGSTYDYILTLLVDNLNFNSKNVIEFMKQLLERGSKQIKRYIIEHIRCLLKFGKDVMLNIQTLMNTLDPNDKDCNNVIISILTYLVLEGRYVDEIVKNKDYINKLSSINKEIIYIMMRNKEAFDLLNDNFINQEIQNIDVEKIIKDYSENLVDSMTEIFNSDDNKNDNYYLHINLPKIENQYENYSELFWLKQLPFNVNIHIMRGNEKRQEAILNSYIEYIDGKNLLLYSKLQEGNNIEINFDENEIKFLCCLGYFNVDRACKLIPHYVNFLTFGSSEFIQKLKIESQNQTYFKIQKEGVTFILNKKDNNKDSKIYSIYSVYFSIKIHPETKQALKTPINIITELPNNEIGYQKIIELNLIDKLFELLNSNKYKNKNTKIIKAILWILGKILIKQTYGFLLQERYNIIEKIIEYFKKCEDYAMKGTISYVLCYISQNKSLKLFLENNHYNYFFNTDICYPEDMNELYMNNSTSYENKKLKEDGEKINKYIILNDKSSEIFNNITSLINSISYKQASEKLNDLIKNDSKAFNDPNLLVKVYAALSRYKFRLPIRRIIMKFLENSINYPDIIDMAVKTMDKISKTLFQSEEQENSIDDNEINTSIKNRNNMKKS